MILDSHQHFWTPARGDYGWISPGDPVLDRAYVPRDLAPILARRGVSGTVLVQAAPTLHETEYLLGLADATEFVRGVVGWVDFEDRAARTQMQRLARHPKLKGFRPMIQNIPDDLWMLGPDVQWAFEALADLDLTFDALGFSRHIGPFLTLLRRHPRLRVVIDHGMKPPIRGPEDFQTWAEGMARLAGETGACVKLSGLVTEAGPRWTPDTLRPWVQHLLATYGPQRIMWGSDWPVCQLAASYEVWLDAAQALTAHLPPAARESIFAGTATAFYRL